MNSVLRRILVIINPQNCFMDLQSKKMPLSVIGAVADMKRVATFIRSNPHYYDEIIVTTDDHPYDHIAHANRWLNELGEHPDPFTIITYQEYLDGVWSAANPDDQYWQGPYLKLLEATGRMHTIWPVHGQSGMYESWLVDEIFQALKFWKQATGKSFSVIRKGQHRDTEQFGVFEANVPIFGAPETGLNRSLVERIRPYDVQDFCGEASSHCVMDSVNQYLDAIPLDEHRRVRVLRDAMSPVSAVTNPETGEVIVDFPAQAAAWLDQLSATGVEVTTTTALTAQAA